MGRFCLACGQHDAREVIDAQSYCERCGARFSVLEGGARDALRAQPSASSKPVKAGRGLRDWLVVATLAGVTALVVIGRDDRPGYVNPHDEPRAAAAYPCKQALQRLARWDYEWTDGITRPLFDSVRFDESSGIYTFAGSQLKLQNGFGAWRHVRYTCEFGKISQMVFNAAIEE